MKYVALFKTILEIVLFILIYILFPPQKNGYGFTYVYFQSPENTKMKLAFDKFDIQSTVDGESSFPICEDSLEVRFTLPGHPGVK